MPLFQCAPSRRQILLRMEKVISFIDFYITNFETYVANFEMYIPNSEI